MESSNSQDTILDAKELRRLLKDLSREETHLFRDLMVDVREAGVGITTTITNELAKKYADKARALAGEGEET